MEEDVEDIIKEDEEVNVLQDQSLGKGQEDGLVDIEQWHTQENTTGDSVRSGDNGKLEKRCRDGDEMRSSDDDLARCNEEKICTDDFVVEMTKRIAVMIMLKETVKKNQKDAMMGGWYPQRKVEKSQAQCKN